MKSKISRKTFQSRLDEMVLRLRQDIANARYAPGSYLPAESALAEQFHLSNKSVRKGLEQLAEEGLIHKINRVGNRVAEPIGQRKTIVTMGCPSIIERDLEMARLIADFQEQYPWIEVRTVTYAAESSAASSSFDKMARSYLENGLMDVMVLNNSQFQEMVEADAVNLFEPLPINGEMYPFVMSPFTDNGEMYVQPVAFSPIILCYNRQHFREGGLLEPDSSWTWSDVLQISDRISKPEDRYGLYFHLLSENRWPIFLLQSAANADASADTNANASSPDHEWLNGARVVQEITQNRRIYPGYITESRDDVNTLFLQGKVSMIMSSYFSMNEFKQASIDYDISPLPYLDRPATLLIILGMAISRSSKNKEAAKLLTSYLASHRAQQQLRDMTLSIPVVKTIAEQRPSSAAGNELNRPAHEAMFRELFPTFRLHKHLQLTVAEQHALRNLLKRFWSGIIDEKMLIDEFTQLQQSFTPQ
ncbi:extracellular solute-binding protein [Paenibacillus eucommiae]|uniref:Multiple sugar transport system substrate-binding protein n=1 Tax=Paenibacillus eucommiae TaxID=1355755 RepID=A0ABS4IV86_9BACL|nr:extracellular solute-binding protein [Paenibacillus eucommiae]MBP1991489.1 multiple sugar transport system substrate-binding protein [Paenibacillus eucommiae]